MTPQKARLEFISGSTNMNNAALRFFSNLQTPTKGNIYIAGVSFYAIGNGQDSKEGVIYNPFRYCGEYIDLETNNYYLRNRHYSTATGRFLTEDLIRDGLNWYTYCANNPIMFIDPSGCRWETEAINDVGGGYTVSGDYVSLVHWVMDITLRFSYLSSVITRDSANAATVIMSNNYGSTARIFYNGVDRTYIGIDNNMYIKRSTLWSEFGLIIDPPLDHHPIRDTIIEGVIIGTGVCVIPKAAAAIVSIGSMSSDALYKGVDFASAALKRMNETGRFVPVQTMIDTIRMGASMPDPRGSRALMYYSQFTKNGEMYNLEVLYDKITNTIWHFKYYR